MGPTPVAPEIRFWAKVVPDGETGCWEWAGSCSGNGYGRFALAHRVFVGAHRFAYEVMVGPIPPGLTIDHLCRNTRCVNPHHLEAVTQRVNGLRGNTVSARNASKTHCLRGHPFDPPNVHLWRNRRICRACRYQQGRRRNDALKRARRAA